MLPVHMPSKEEQGNYLKKSREHRALSDAWNEKKLKCEECEVEETKC